MIKSSKDQLIHSQVQFSARESKQIDGVSALNYL